MAASVASRAKKFSAEKHVAGHIEMLGEVCQNICIVLLD